MTWSLLFFTTNIFLGIGLAMDAFSVSMANGLNEPHMNKGVYAQLPEYLVDFRHLCL